MLKNPQDRRAKRTAVQIKEAMFSMMAANAIHEIKVSEICKLCQINRATFYDHYRDVFDLVQDMERDILLALQELMNTVSSEEMEAGDVSRLFFYFLDKHREALHLLITSERSREFCTTLDAQLMPFFEKKIRQNYEIPENMDVQLRCAMEFVSSGYYRFWMNALTTGRMRINEEAETCARLSDACLELLFRKKEKKTNISSEFGAKPDIRSI